MLAAMRPFFILCLAASVAPAQDVLALFKKNCATCHQAGSEMRAPLPSALKLLSKEKILAALETGSMKAQGAALTSAERMALAAHLSGGASLDGAQAGAACPAAKFSFAAGEPSWTG